MAKECRFFRKPVTCRSPEWSYPTIFQNGCYATLTASRDRRRNTIYRNRATTCLFLSGFLWGDRERNHHLCRAACCTRFVQHAGLRLINILFWVGKACFGENTITDWPPGPRTPASHARRCLAVVPQVARDAPFHRL